MGGLRQGPMGGMAGLAELRVMLSTGRRADLGLGTAAAIGVGARWGAVTGAGGGEEERGGWRMRNLGAQPPPADAAESSAYTMPTLQGTVTQRPRAVASCGNRRGGDQSVD